MADRTCSIAGCERAWVAQTLCMKHYKRVRRYGAAEASVLPPKPSPPRRFSKMELLEILIQQQTEECIEWPHTRLPTGYGRLSHQGRFVYSHRMALVLAGIEPSGPEQNVVRHLCHNPPCVNPRHLRWGTYQDNVNDRQERGVWHEAMRSRRAEMGDGAGSARLSEWEIQQICHYGMVGMLPRVIGHRYGVSEDTVRKICDERGVERPRKRAKS